MTPLQDGDGPGSALCSNNSATISERGPQYMSADVNAPSLLGLRAAGVSSSRG